MAKEDEKEKKGIVSGILNDLAMGFGLKERDQDYYERTARTIGRDQGQSAGDRYLARMQSQNYPSYGGPLAFIGSGAGPRDFFDGGGLGRSGDRFVGGPMSMLANALGVRPMGYYDRARIGQRGGAGALAALQAGTIPTNVMAPPVGNSTEGSYMPLTAMSSPSSQTVDLNGNPATLSSRNNRLYTEMADFQPFLYGIGKFSPSPDSFIENPPTGGFSENPPSSVSLTSPMSDVPLQPAGPAVKGSGKHPQYLYDQGYSDMFLDSLPEQDLEFLYSFNPAGR